MVKPVISLIRLISMFFAFIDFAIEIALFFSPSFIPSSFPFLIPSLIPSCLSSLSVICYRIDSFLSSHTPSSSIGF